MLRRRIAASPSRVTDPKSPGNGLELRCRVQDLGLPASRGADEWNVVWGGILYKKYMRTTM